jgi:hypothetical protein
LSRDHHAIQIQLVDVFGKEPAGAFQKGTAANRTIKTVLVLAAKRKDLRRRLPNDDIRFESGADIQPSLAPGPLCFPKAGIGC